MRFSQLRVLCLWFALTVYLSGNPARANPTGEVVRYGDVTFARVGNELRVLQQTDRAIIDWLSFSIPEGETTSFIQPGVQSVVLNRVRGNSTSLINGSLRSNGQVLLINPNGILFGRNARVDVGGLVASTLDVSDSNFLAGGDLTFSGSSEAAVINLGSISAFEGNVYLFAKTVQNSGNIAAPNGRVGLASGSEILLRESGDERVFVKAASGESKSTGVSNSGSIRGVAAELKSYGGNIYGMAVKNEGRIAATTVTRRGGQIFLGTGGSGGRISNTGTMRAENASGGGDIRIDAGKEGRTEIGGTVDASGGSGTGGSVVILGQTVDVIPNTVILADGDTGGGSIRIGGGRQGLDPLLANAQFVNVAHGVRIDASAKLEGNGGEVVLFATDTLDFQGLATARGGTISGDGGFVELSGKRGVNFGGFMNSVDVSAPNGRGGSLLFDPTDINIVPGSGPIVVFTFADNGDGTTRVTVTSYGGPAISGPNGTNVTTNLGLSNLAGAAENGFTSYDPDINFNSPGGGPSGIYLPLSAPFEYTLDGNPGLYSQLFVSDNELLLIGNRVAGQGNSLVFSTENQTATAAIDYSLFSPFYGQTLPVVSDDGWAFTFNSEGPSATSIYENDINNFLATGSNLEILTDEGGAGLGNITIEPNVHINWNSPGNLRFTAHNTFQLDSASSITSTGGGNLEVLAQNITVDGAITLTGGGDFTAGITPFIEGGPLTVTINAPVTADSITFNGGPSPDTFNLFAPLNFGDFTIDGAFEDESFDAVYVDGSFNIGTTTLIDIETIEGVGEADTLIGPDTAPGILGYYVISGNSITMSTSYPVTGLSYDGFENLIAGSGDDDFEIVDAPTTLSIDGNGGSNYLSGPNTDDAFIISENFGGTLNSTISFANMEGLIGQGGNDSFIFRNQATLDWIDGATGIDTILIDDSSLEGNHNYTISEELVSRNPQYSFFDIEGLTLLLGTGNDTVHTTATSFAQALNGGDGIDSLLFDGSVVTESPFSVVSHTNFEFPFDEIVDQGPIPDMLPGNEIPEIPDVISDQGAILNIQIGNTTPEVPVGEAPAVENNFDGSEDASLEQQFGLSPGVFISLGGGFSAGVLGQALVVLQNNSDMESAPTGIDGSPPPFGVVVLLGEELKLGAFSELASAIDFEGATPMSRSDGPYAIDLSGPPPGDVVAAMKNNLLVAAALELLDALELGSGAPVTAMDGAIVIGVGPAALDPATIALLEQQLGEQAFADLRTALEF